MASESLPLPSQHSATYESPPRRRRTPTPLALLPFYNEHHNLLPFNAMSPRLSNWLLSGRDDSRSNIVNIFQLFPTRVWVTAPSETPSGPRTIVLCLDGTENHFCEKTSNVFRLFECLKKDDESQLVYYQTGIGTYTSSRFFTHLGIYLSKKVDAAIAWNLEHHVLDAYRFLMQNYRHGDKISLFGFSRGAYIAQVLAGFVQKIGLLPRENLAQIPFAWNIFKQSDDDCGLNVCADYKKAFSVTVKIDFIGLWDTVASVGIHGRELPFAKHFRKTGIRVFRQALALDEHRVKFTPNFLVKQPDEDHGTPEVLSPPHMHGGFTQPRARLTWGVESQRRPLSETGLGACLLEQVDPDINHRLDHEVDQNVAPPNKPRHERPTVELERDVDAITNENVLEVWFAGCHSDVGGGSVPNHTRNSLARIPLRWMIHQCFRMKTGIKFDGDMLIDIGFDHALYSEGPVIFHRTRPSHDDSNEASNVIVSFLRLFWKFIQSVTFWIWTLLRHAILFLTWPVRHLYRLIMHVKGIKTMMKRSPRDHSEDHVNSENQGNDWQVNTDDEDYHDALSPIYDQLCEMWFWWALEVWPFLFRLQYAKRNELETRINFGGGRKIYGDAWNRDTQRQKSIYVHRSVLTRMKGSNRNYRPRACFTTEGRDFHWEAEITESTSEDDLAEAGLGWKCIKWVGTDTPDSS